MLGMQGIRTSRKRYHLSSIQEQELEHYEDTRNRFGSGIYGGKSLVLDRNRDQGRTNKEVVNGNGDTETKMVRVSTCAVRDTEKKIEGKHLVFKTSIAGIKTRLLIDNGSEAELIDESFVRKHKLSPSNWIRR